MPRRIRRPWGPAPGRRRSEVRDRSTGAFEKPTRSTGGFEEPAGLAPERDDPVQGPVQLGPELPGVVHAEPAGEPHELVRTGGRDGQVPGVSVDHAEGVDQLAVEVI